METKFAFIVPYYDKDIFQLSEAIESIECYYKNDFIIVCVNDCDDERKSNFVKKHLKSKRIFDFKPIYDQKWEKNGYGALFCKLYQGMKYAVDNFNFKYLVKMDTDALITGDRLYEYLENFYNNCNEKIGLLGSYKIKSDGENRSRWEWAIFLVYFIYIKNLFKRKMLFLKNHFSMAKKNGYRIGESVLGGAYIFKNECIKKIIKNYKLEEMVSDKIYETRIGEDVLFSLLTFSNGFKIADFGRPNEPLAISHKCIPIKKEEIINNNKQIIHSVKMGKNGENEDEIREYFKRIRCQNS